MDQQHLNFIDDEASSYTVNLDKERRQSLLELMGNVIIHVFQSQEKKSDEQPQKVHKN